MFWSLPGKDYLFGLSDIFIFEGLLLFLFFFLYIWVERYIILVTVRWVFEMLVLFCTF